jgi:transcriptional regulator with XRE-family HTH domain
MDSDFKIGNMIYVERHQAGMGRSEFAKLCYMTPDAMKRIEIGTRKVRPYELYEIAKQLGNTMEHYLGKPQLVDKTTTINEIFEGTLEALHNLGVRK